MMAMTPAQANMWENDPSLLPYTAQRAKAAREGAFRSMRSDKNLDLCKYRPAYRAEYEAWLKKNPKA